MIRRVNLHDAQVEYDDANPAGFSPGSLRIGPELGANMVAGTVYELPSGEAVCPYHYEYNEEWVIVLAGAPSVRHPEGEETLSAGDVVCFPVGPEGAHQLVNRAAETARILMFSTRNRPEVAIYPDSGKVGVWMADPEDVVMFRRADQVDYFEGEA